MGEAKEGDTYQEELLDYDEEDLETAPEAVAAKGTGETVKSIMNSLTKNQILTKETKTTMIEDKEIENDVKKMNDIRYKLRNLIVKVDCMKFMKKLPANVMDCIITSPPYNKGNKICYNTYEDTVPWDEYQNDQVAILRELYRITKPGGHLWYVHKVQHFETYIFHPVEWISKSPWKIRNEIAWNRRSSINCNPYRFKPLDERIYWLHKPGPKEFELNSEVSKWGSVWFTPDDRSAMYHTFRHPAPFSLYLIIAILHAMELPAGSLIYDPYGGIGTTAKACQVSNHHYVTTEIDREYVKMIKNRLQKTTETDEYLILIIMKQIMTHTLDLSMNLKMPEIQPMLQMEPWDVPKTRSAEEVRIELLERYRKKKIVYYRKYPKPRRLISRKTANYSYSTHAVPYPMRYVLKNASRGWHQNPWVARMKINKASAKLRLKQVRMRA